MERDKKLVAAISTAVTTYIKEEDMANRARRDQVKHPISNTWAQAGRQEIMRNRQMWQLRIVPG